MLLGQLKAKVCKHQVLKVYETYLLQLCAKQQMF